MLEHSPNGKIPLKVKIFTKTQKNATARIRVGEQSAGNLLIKI